MTADTWAWLRKAARSGGLARQAALSPDDRKALATKASRARFKGMTKWQRSAAARAAVQARWAKAKRRGVT